MLDLSKFTLYPIEKALKPPTTDGTFEVYTNRYWEVYQGNLMFYNGSSPQCNKNKSAAEKLAFKYGTEVMFLEVVYIHFTISSDMAGYPVFKVIAD